MDSPLTKRRDAEGFQTDIALKVPRTGVTTSRFALERCNPHLADCRLVTRTKFFVPQMIESWNQLLGSLHTWKNLLEGSFTPSLAFNYH